MTIREGMNQAMKNNAVADNTPSEPPAGSQGGTEGIVNLGEPEFVRRFTAEMIALVGPTYFDEGDPEPQSTADYGSEVGPAYYAEPWQREEGPEECARADYSYWGG